MYSIENYKGKKYIKINENFDGLKICMTTKDSDLGVKTEERAKITKKILEEAFEFLEIKPDQTFILDQAHTDIIKKVDSLNAGEEFITGRIFYKADGLITNLKNVVLISRFADCVPILIYDEKNLVQASIHSGWRGTLQRIAAKGLKKLIYEYKSDPKDIKVLFGPAIGFEDFEVKEDVKEKFSKEFLEEFSDMKNFIKIKDEEHYLIDLVGINIKMLLNFGVKIENIFKIPLSTYSTNFLKSYRRDKDRTTMGMISILKK